MGKIEDKSPDELDFLYEKLDRIRAQETSKLSNQKQVRILEPFCLRPSTDIFAAGYHFVCR